MPSLGCQQKMLLTIALRGSTALPPIIPLFTLWHSVIPWTHVLWKDLVSLCSEARWGPGCSFLTLAREGARQWGIRSEESTLEVRDTTKGHSWLYPQYRWYSALQVADIGRMLSTAPCIAQVVCALGQGKLCRARSYECYRSVFRLVQREEQCPWLGECIREWEVYFV